MKTSIYGNPRNIAAVLPSTSTMYVDEMPSNNIHYYYTVTALDKGHNESTGSSVRYESQRMTIR